MNAATGGEVKRLYPDEGRKTITALVTLQDFKTKQPLIKPFRVTSQTSYDFVNPVAKKDIEFIDLNGIKKSTLQYSLGQLDSEEGARGEASNLLYQDLAFKIAEVLARAPKQPQQSS